MISIIQIGETYAFYNKLQNVKTLLLLFPNAQNQLARILTPSRRKSTITACNVEGVHIAPRGAKKEEAFGGVILKSERPSGALFTNSGPPFFTVESKIEVLSPLGTSFH